MQTWQVAILIKPYVLLIMFLPGALVASWLRRVLPEGRMKRILLFSWTV